MIDPFEPVARNAPPLDWQTKAALFVPGAACCMSSLLLLTAVFLGVFK